MEMTNDILTLAALVAAIVGVIKAFGAGTKYEATVGKLAPVFALFIAAVFVLVPDEIQSKVTLICVIGLTASGAYHYTKNSTGGGGGTKSGGSNTGV